MPTRKTLAERFWSKVDKGEHWMWIGAVSEGRNGFIQAAGRNRLAHQVAYELTHGVIPEGQTVTHACGVSLCVRPEHLALKSRGASLTDRFFERVKKTSGCWFWQGARDDNGYGVINRGGRGTGKILAHRLSWEIHHGPLSPEDNVLHKCDTPPCVNPDHLETGTRTLNQQQMVERGRSRKGETHQTAVLKEAQVREIRRRYAARDPRPSTRVWRNPDSFAAMSDDYGVNEATIRDIVYRETWRHI